MLLPLEIPPGVVKVDSPNGAKGRFIDCDKVWFNKGKPEKWPGWQQFIPDTMLGICRGAVSWVNTDGNTNAAFGTHLKLYAVTGDDTLTDITPIRATGTLNGPFDTTSGDATVTVNHVGHGVEAGAYVTFSGATSVGGLDMNFQWVVGEVIDADTYTFEHSSTASSTASGGGGASVAYSYEINVGTSGGVVGLGWGAGTWGSGTWSTPRDSGISIGIRFWSLVGYGNDLLASPSGGGLYLWQEATDARAEIVSGAPTSMRAMFVTGERYVFALGTTTGMTVQWPDVDDITDWTPAADNTANLRKLQSGSQLVNGTPLADGVNLVWSDTSCYLFQYTGSEFVYDDRLVGTSCGLIGPLAFAKVSGAAFWMSGDNFWMYSSGVQLVPNADDIRNWVFGRMNKSQLTKTFAIFEQKNNQIRWHYCSGDNTEPDSYVDVSLYDFSWTVGTLARTGGTPYRAGDSSMLLVDENGVIYTHGVGLDADTVPMESYITFGLYALSRSEANVDVVGLVPDCQRQVGTLDYEIYTKERPNSASNLDEQTLTLAPTDEIGDARVCGRHFGMTVRSDTIGGDYRLGIVNLEVQQGGGRR